MKKLINGKVYDTESAFKLGEIETPLDKDNPAYFKAGLYLTPISRRFFLAGTGGGLTRFGTKLETDEKVIPISSEQAKNIAESFQKYKLNKPR